VAVGDVDLSQSGYRIMVGSHSFEAPGKEKNAENTEPTKYTLNIADKSSDITSEKARNKESKVCCVVS